jgi:hypothetical protein
LYGNEVGKMIRERFMVAGVRVDAHGASKKIRGYLTIHPTYCAIDSVDMFGNLTGMWKVDPETVEPVVVKAEKYSEDFEGEEILIAKCPNCGERIYKWDCEPNYCADCGQRID